MNRLYHILSLLLLVLLANVNTQAQNISVDQANSQKDLVDIIHSLFNIQGDSTIPESKASISFLPVIGYNPSFGGIIGFNSIMGKQFGDPLNTDYSVFNLMFTASSSGVTTLQSRHNIFRPENKWNFQGNWQFSFYGLVDHGLGTGNTTFCFMPNDGDGIPAHVNDSIFPIRYHYLRLSEKAYHEINSGIYVGAGVNFNLYNKIDDIYLSDSMSTPHNRYSKEHNFNSKKYSVNGLQLAFQYNTRDQPIRPYNGMYFDLNFEYNPKWLGSSETSTTLGYDLRKYFSLSKRNPTHVLAFWHWANYQITGERPYLNLPYTGSDTYNRSGRGYTIGYFRGPSYAYFESEYRYPILHNGLVSGVLFINVQSAGNDIDSKVFHAWNIGGGAGLRILFTKRSRSALCIDFSQGNCGSSGVFFGLNEVF